MRCPATQDIRFVLISPPELRVPDYIREDALSAKGIEYKEVENLDEAMPELDILYMTRVQRERFFNEEDYIRYEGLLHSRQEEDGARQG